MRLRTKPRRNRVLTKPQDRGVSLDPWKRYPFSIILGVTQLIAKEPRFLSWRAAILSGVARRAAKSKEAAKPSPGLSERRRPYTVRETASAGFGYAQPASR